MGSMHIRLFHELFSLSFSLSPSPSPSHCLSFTSSLPLTLHIFLSFSLRCWVFGMNTGCGLNNPCTAILSRSYDDSQFDLLPLNDQQKLLFIAFCLLRPKSLIDSMALQHIVIVEKVCENKTRK